MATVNSIRVNDSGVLFLITVRDESGVVDLSTVQGIDLFFQRPDRSIVQFTPQIVGDGHSGLISYTSTATDFNVAGRWRYQVVVRFANDNVKHSDIGSLNVENNLPI
jgi:hypothetical protein